MAHTGISEWRWLRQEVRPFVRYQAATLLCILSASFVSLVDPRIMKRLIANIRSRPHRDALPIAAVLFFAARVGRRALSAWGSRITFLAGPRLMHGRRVRRVDRVHARAIVVMSIFTVTTMLILDWRLTSLVVPLFPRFAFVRLRYRIMVRRVADRSPRGARLNPGTMRVNMVRRRVELVFTHGAMSLRALGPSLIIGIDGARVIFGGLTAGSLVALYSYIGYRSSPFTTAVERCARLMRVRASLGERPQDIDFAARLGASA